MRDHPSTKSDRPSDRPPRRLIPIADATPTLLESDLPALVDDAPWHNGELSATRNHVIAHVVTHVRIHLAVGLADKPRVTATNLLVNVCTVGRRWVLDDVAGRTRRRLESAGIDPSTAAARAPLVASSVVDASRSDQATALWWITQDDCPLDDLAILVLLRVLPLVGVWARVHAAATALLVPAGLGAAYVKELRQSVLAGAGGQARVTVAMRPRLATFAGFAELLGSPGDDLHELVTVLLADRIIALRANNLSRWAPADRRVMEKTVEDLCRARAGLAEAIQARSGGLPRPRGTARRPISGGVMALRTVDEELAELGGRGSALAQRWGISGHEAADLVNDVVVEFLERHHRTDLVEAGTWRAVMSRLSGRYRRRTELAQPDVGESSPSPGRMSPVTTAHSLAPVGERAAAYVGLLHFFASADEEKGRPEVLLARELLSNVTTVTDPAKLRLNWDDIRTWAYGRIDELGLVCDRDTLTTRLRVYLQQLVRDVLPDVASTLTAADARSEPSGVQRSSIALALEEGD